MSSSEEQHEVDWRRRALDLLMRREHSTVELTAKLVKHGCAPMEAADCVVNLACEGLQSDLRFAESLARTRVESGHGPQRIRAELVKHEVDGGTIENALGDLEVDWVALASRVRVKRFGGDRPEDYTAKAKQLKFLTYRGFTEDQARKALAKRTPDPE